MILVRQFVAVFYFFREVDKAICSLVAYKCNAHKEIVNKFTEITEKNLDHTVGIVTGDGLDDQGVGVLLSVRVTIFISPRLADRLRGPLSPLSNGYRVLSPGVKRPGREAEYSSPGSAEVENMWIYISTPPYVFMA
jgi:hypothetical protein